MFRQLYQILIELVLWKVDIRGSKLKKILVPKPVSAGIFLTYKCSSECKHCMYACSPRWRADWISEKDLETILTQLSETILPSPLGPERIGINYGLHFTGGEPFLNFDLLLKGVEIAHELGIPSIFVETNSYWCADDRNTREKLGQLRDSGLNGLLISVNPFIIEQVPFERTVRAIRISEEIFGADSMVYQEAFHRQFKRLGVKGTVSFEEYLQKVGLSGMGLAELLPLGRANYKLKDLYRKYPAKEFFKESCMRSLTREWHVHIDNYGNYIPGYCGGISLGDGRDLSSIYGEIDLENRRVLHALATDLEELYEVAVREFGYKELEEGYISKCHFCLDARRHMVQMSDEFEELRPKEFYSYLT